MMGLFQRLSDTNYHELNEQQLLVLVNERVQNLRYQMTIAVWVIVGLTFGALVNTLLAITALLTSAYVWWRL